jgi:hypothetical protein
MPAVYDMIISSKPTRNFSLAVLFFSCLSYDSFNDEDRSESNQNSHNETNRFITLNTGCMNSTNASVSSFMLLQWVIMQNDRTRQRQAVGCSKAHTYTGRFIMFSVITNIYNKKTKEPTLMELFTATGKLKKFFF